jgi:hypothetical protein
LACIVTIGPEPENRQVGFRKSEATSLISVERIAVVIVSARVCSHKAGWKV